MSDTQTEFITKAFVAFIDNHSTNHVPSGVDDIVLSYVVTVLEELITGSDSEDVTEFCELLQVHFPYLSELSSEEYVQEWLKDLKTSLTSLKKKTINDEKDEQLCEEREPRIKSSSESSTDSAVSSASSRQCGSDCHTDDVCDLVARLEISEYGDEDKVATLQELFPSISRAAAANLLVVAHGDLERAVQTALLQEDGYAVSFPQRLKCSSVSKHVNGAVVDEKAVKDRIVARYGFIDQAEDLKEFKPAPPKQEPKKLVRYRDGQVVSTKGERFSEVQYNKSGEETKFKPYLTKPKQQ